MGSKMIPKLAFLSVLPLKKVIHRKDKTYSRSHDESVEESDRRSHAAWLLCLSANLYLKNRFPCWAGVQNSSDPDLSLSSPLFQQYSSAGIWAQKFVTRKEVAKLKNQRQLPGFPFMPIFQSHTI